jgi:hypothetical protein
VGSVIPLSVSRNGQITLDANGIPYGHYAARDTAANFLREWLVQLPNSVVVSIDDAEDIMDVALSAYLSWLKAEQRQ